MLYRLIYSETSHNQIRRLHPDLKAVVRVRIKRLVRNPYMGKALERELSGYFSLKTKRFRVIYMVKDTDQAVEIHYVGHRKDIYQLVREQAK